MSNELTSPMGETADPHVSTGQQIVGRLDRLPTLTRTPRLWLVILGTFYAFDIFDLAVSGYVAPAWRTHWGTTVSQIGWVASATFAGSFVGAIVGGRLSDRFGRKKVILSGIALTSIGSLATALAPNIETVVALRFVTGMGIQAMVAALMVYLSEFLPTKLRGRFVSMIVAVGFTSAPVAAIFATVIVPLSGNSWRWMFVIGSLGAVVALCASGKLPESVRWLVANDRYGEAEQVVAGLEAEARVATGVPLPDPVPVFPVQHLGVRALLSRKHFGRLVVACIGMIGIILTQYGFASWIPVLLVERGYTNTEALTYSTTLAVAGAVGALSPYLYIDRWQRRFVVVGLALILAGTVLIFGFSGSMTLVFGIGLLTMAAINALTAVMYIYVPELFPTAIRGTGNGIAQGVGRISGIAGSFAVPIIYSGFGFSAIYVYVALVSVVLAVVFGVFGARTTNQRLA